ncbi:MAG: bifunctional anthranilate synthase component I family protein/aminotransferase class IV [Polynucleobacter sp.]|jgi:para-aminobenzoate synthetase/4-amino-4-deoxychorismate lyase|nr:bifunctional anthranilate synthase component I family protein/aminotransferase class IV [Polynucleobacter sp.]
MLLLDDAESSAKQPSSRLYGEVQQQWRAQEWQEVPACLEAIEAALKNQHYVVAVFAYELGLHLQKIPLQYQANTPLIQAWSFNSVEKISKQAVDDYLSMQINALQNDSHISGICDLSHSVTQAQFEDSIETIQEWIRKGDTYQINRTYQIQGSFYGAPLALYARLRSRQPGRYGAFIQIDDTCILSQSPELFIQKKNNQLEARPMKGTADAFLQQASDLSDDPKNQAENVMIVDLLRNDLSKIALPNSVKVPALFEVNRYGNVLQMTSTIQAEAKPKLSLLEILKAIFPCGSVTGAPKKRSMEIIQALEQTPRGWYCGALGWFDPDDHFALSVPIRTLQLEMNPASGKKHFILGIGAGVTIDSEPRQEWQECSIKAKFLTELKGEIGLFETMRVQANNPNSQRIPLLQAHLNRLENSARALCIPFSRDAAELLINELLNIVPPEKNVRLRLDLSHHGKLSSNHGVIDDLPTLNTIFWASDLIPDARMHSENALLLHKTTQRQLYDQAWQTAEARGGFDAIFENEKGFVTEGGRTSLFIRPANTQEWLTPPLSAGVLPGVMRQHILQDPKWNAHEANLTKKDVSIAEEMMLTNALRGTISVVLSKPE